MWYFGVFLYLLIVLTVVDGGCKRRKATNVKPEELSFGEQPNLGLDVSTLPKSYSWLDVNGVNMLAPSWNQHIVR